MIFVAGYGCTTAAGDGAAALWDGMSLGRDHSEAYRVSDWPVPLTFVPRACLWPGHYIESSVRARHGRHLQTAWREAGGEISRNALSSLGVILASTKGFIEDLVWSGEPEAGDPIAPLLADFLGQSELQPTLSAVISNACASSHSSLWLAKEWLHSGRVKNVVVLAVDGVGPFVLQGFHALHATTAGKVKPFAEDRSGLQLGEAAVAIWLSIETESDLLLEGAALDAEGYAVTRPKPSGASLLRAISALALPHSPDLIFAHGTGTEINDATEDHVYFSLYQNTCAITASKWSIGHTLAASGAVDFVLAAESIRRGQPVRIANTDSADPVFKCRYLTGNSEVDIRPKRILVTSLGFGGIHAAASIAARVGER